MNKYFWLPTIGASLLLGAGCAPSNQSSDKASATESKSIDYFEKKKECAVYYPKQLRTEENIWETDGKALGDSRICFSKKYNTCAFIYDVNTVGTKYMIGVDDALSGGTISWNEGTPEHPGESAFASDFIQASMIVDDAAKAVDCAE